jgi:molecular chaperone HtpG
MDMHLERMLKQHRQLEAGFKRVLEVNPRTRWWSASPSA